MSQTIDFFELHGNAVDIMSTPDHAQNWLIADVGATNSRCALLSAPAFAISMVRHYRNDDATSLQEILANYLLETDASPSNCALAVAAPVDGDNVGMSNRDWRFNRHEISRRIGVEETFVINDFEAIAYALPFIHNDHKAEIGHATQYRDANVAALGPGSGLGMTAWIKSDFGGAAMRGEGGHITLSGRDEKEDVIIANIRERFGHCTAESVLSGPGIIALHRAMHDVDGLSSEEISTRIDDPLCSATMDQFFRFLGSAAADLALITGAVGGIYIAGGIVPDCIEQIRKSDFRTRFEDKDSYHDYMRAKPTWVVTDPTPGLTGLSAFVRQVRTQT
jgi:glucokinase